MLTNAEVMAQAAIVCKPELSALAEQFLAAHPGEVLQVEQAAYQAMASGGWLQLVHVGRPGRIVSARVCDPYKW